MAGPLVQMPSVLVPILDYTLTPVGGLDKLHLKQEWGQYLHALETIAFNGTRSGSTSVRPTSSTQGRWIGMPYFDTDLGYDVFLKSVNPDVWASVVPRNSVYVTKTNTFTTTSTAFTDVTGLSSAITPRSTASKIRIIGSLCVGNNNATNGGFIKVLRNGADILIGDAASTRTRALFQYY